MRWETTVEAISAALRVSARARRSVGLIVAVLVAGCGGSSDAADALPGRWVGTGQAPGEVTMVLDQNGSFTWSNGELEGSWEANGQRLTFSYPDSSSFCPGGSITWEYELDGDSLTSDLVEGTRAGFSTPPGSPDWTFMREEAP